MTFEEEIARKLFSEYDWDQTGPVHAGVRERLIAQVREIINGIEEDDLRRLGFAPARARLQAQHRPTTLGPG